MTVTVKLFAMFQDIAGTNELQMDVSDSATVGEVIETLERQYPQFDGQISKLGLVAINEKYAHRRKALQSNDILALFPTVSGG